MLAFWRGSLVSPPGSQLEVSGGLHRATSSMSLMEQKDPRCSRGRHGKESNFSCTVETGKAFTAQGTFEMGLEG